MTEDIPQSAFTEYDRLVGCAEEELYTALEALEKGDLPFARSSAARAQGLINEAHKARAKAEGIEPKQKA